MLSEAQLFEQIANEVKQLSLEYRLRLINFTAQTLTESGGSKPSKPLRYGQFHYDETKMSTLEDFTLAEWHPTNREMNGA